MPKPTPRTKTSQRRHVLAEKCDICGQIDLNVEVPDAVREKRIRALFADLEAADAEIDAGLGAAGSPEELMADVYAELGLTF